MQTASDVEWKKLWNPKLYVDNSIGELKEDIWFTMYMSRTGEAYAVERRRVRGNFVENLELQEFPFDIQVKHCLIFRFFLLIYSFKKYLQTPIVFSTFNDWQAPASIRLHFKRGKPLVEVNKNWQKSFNYLSNHPKNVD